MLLGLLAGGLANWIADTLPGWAPGKAAQKPGPPKKPGFSPLSALRHYLTLPWYTFRDGVCPHCGEHRPIRAPVLELAMIIGFLLDWRLAPPAPWPLSPAAWSLAAAWIYTAFLLTVAVIDLEHRRVLNLMLAPMTVVAMLLSLRPGGPGTLSAALGGLAGLALFAIIGLLGRGKMGAGDVKLAGVIGLMTGFPDVFRALLIGVILGGLAALVLILSRRAALKSYIAYAPYLALGAWVVMVWR